MELCIVKIISWPRRINIPRTTLKHHIRYLEKVGLIKEIGDDKYKRFFICDDVYIRDKKIFSFIRKETPLRICLYLCFAFSFSQTELAKALDVNYKSLSYYIKKMLEMGIIEEANVVDGVIRPNEACPRIIERKTVSSEKIYRRKNWEINDKIFSMLIANKFDFNDKDIIKSYIDILKNIKSFGTDEPTKILKVDSYFDNIIGFFEDSFRPPFCA